MSGEEQSYSSAKTLLDRAFSSINQKFELIQRMINLTLPYPGEPYRFISEFRTISDDIQRLNLDVATVFQYFVLNGINDKFNSILMNLTSKTKPTVEEINDKLFDIVDRYLLDIKVDHKSNVAGMAVNVNYTQSKDKFHKAKLRQCILCSSLKNVNSDHPIYKCERFNSVESKLDRLKAIGACLKCGNDNHLAKDCKFKFKRSCQLCGKYHFDYLCTKKLLKDSSDVSRGLSSSNVTVNSTFLASNRAVILPTFSFETSSGTVLRGMKDSGSQCNFIKESVAISLSNIMLILMYADLTRIKSLQQISSRYLVTLDWENKNYWPCVYLK